MSEKTLRTLAVVAAVLVLGWGVTWLAGRRSGGDDGAPSELARLLDGVGPDAVSSVRFGGTDGAIVLGPGPEGWTVNGFRADSATVARFWTALSDPEVRGPVARNTRNHPRMGVDEASAVEVSFETAETTRTFLLGDAGSSPGTAFARLPGADEVYLVPGDLRGHATRSLDEWRDRGVVALDTSRVAGLSAEGSPSWSVARGEDGWRLADGAPADSTTVERLLGELADLRAAGFLAEGDSLAATPSAARLVATAGPGDTLAALSLGEGEGDRWLRVEGDSVTYRVSRFRAERLLPAAEDVRGGG